MQTGWMKPDTAAQTEINGITRFVVCAANKYGDEVIMGIRHHCPLMRGNMDARDKRDLKAGLDASDLNVMSCQGFVDQWGNWLSRDEAFNLVKATGQQINWERNGCNKTLYSEGLYSI